MDTSRLELQAENLINSTLSKYDFLVSKPQYDTDGCDLQILDNSLHPTRLIRIQSKGRTFTNSTNVEIPKIYVNESFILFLYTIDEDKDEGLYIFFPEEIKEFPSNEINYKLYCSKSTFETKYYSNLFTKEKAMELKKRLLSAKIKEETTVLIDSLGIGVRFFSHKPITTNDGAGFGFLTEANYIKGSLDPRNINQSPLSKKAKKKHLAVHKRLNAFF